MILVANLINVESLVPLALFGAFAALAWWALDFMAVGRPRALERLLDRLSGGGKGVRVSHEQDWLVTKLLPVHLGCPAQHTAAQFQAAGLPRRAQGLRN